MRKLIILFFFLPAIVFANHHYIIQPSGTTNSLKSITFANENTGVCVGDFSTILQTSNGGSNWNNIDISSSNTVYNCVAFANSSIAFVVSDAGELIKTTNGGLNWQISSLSGSALKYVYFFNETMGFICGVNGTLFKTTNTGVNWTNASLSISEVITKIVFSDANYGYFLTGTSQDTGSVYKTTNGGNNWLRIDNFYSGYTGHKRLLDCAPLNRDTVYISLGYYQTGIMRTINGGQSWQYIYNHFQMGIYPGTFTELFFKDRDNLWAMNGPTDGVSCYIVKSSNAGFNFTHHSTYHLFGYMNDVYFFRNSAIGYVCGGSGYILKMTSYVTGINSQQGVTTTNNSYSISPNPGGNVIKIQTGTNTDNAGAPYNLKIFDVSGREVKSFLLSGNENSVDISSLPGSVYFIKIFSDEKEFYFKKFVKLY